MLVARTPVTLDEPRLVTAHRTSSLASVEPRSAPPTSTTAIASSSRPSTMSSVSTAPTLSRSTSPVEQHKLLPAQKTAPAGGRPDKAKLTEQWGPPPDVITRGNTLLHRGRLLGEGGFARVYMCTEVDQQAAKALKVIAKEQLKSTKNKSKLFGEIKIHQAMIHPNIISFEHCFEDEGCVYMQLELCANGSMLDLLRRRKRYTEPEARFYLVQLIGACEYMHSNSVIHRDLKLGNLMLDAAMNLRVGDFGLAALVKFPGERKKTICGTPNYIAPEILFDTTNGHSFEVDIWSIGVILYTLLVGKPPFQTKEVKQIYRNIKALNYEFPPDVDLSPEAIELVASILTQQPENRPTLSAILDHAWFKSGPFPSAIPVQAMHGVPEYRKISARASLRNFEAVKASSGLGSRTTTIDKQDVADEARVQEQSAPLAQIAEVDDDATTSKAKQSVVAHKVASPPRVRTASTREVRGMEKEVERALAPDSPISDLLRSARKPLMVSPRTAAGLNTKTSGGRGLFTASASANAEPKFPARSTSLPKPAAATSARSLDAKENEPARNQTHTSRHQRKSAMTASVLSPSRRANVETVVETVDERADASASKQARTAEAISTRYPARELYEATWQTLDAALTIRTRDDLEALPIVANAEAPKVFITSWVDYTHKYGTAYSLTDGTAGLYFNDSTTMVLSPDKVHFDYISNRKGNVYSRRHYTTQSHPEDLSRKSYLLEYFEDYMAKTLTRDVSWTFVDQERIKNMDFLVKYYRMKNAIVFKLSNQVLQFNFYDHTKILLTDRGTVITYISPSFKLKTCSIGEMFRQALKLGYYSKTAPSPKHDQAGSRLEEIRLIATKLEYCRDVLKSLSLRKTQQAQKQQQQQQH
ncbi:Cell cycle serine/threonine-protein kinase cdc5/MSD2 [Microbotryomycetes sp. JL201]|nr:Cell cycle serine/threonine-protein kinase cdc5/MSD2 [Microbotryomycetes sp. JL201]